ncbi:MAG: two-component system sensor histidine kinase NtrB, partial [Limisphaerales bacterium]
VKNALVACKTFIDLLLEKNQDTELAQIVHREMGRIDTLVSRMLKFAGRGAINYGPIHVNEIIERSLRLLERQMEDKSIVLVRSLEAQPDLVPGDEHELQQALVNLLLNALEAMALKGTLTVTSAVTSSALGPGHLTIAIQDTGIGIPPEVLSRLFEPFVTTKPSGTGLGLAITKQIVHHHRGTITARSHPGQGTTFTIVLPMLPAAA